VEHERGEHVSDEETTGTDVIEHNRATWNRQSAARSNRWTVPVSAEEVARAKEGDWEVILTPNKPVPREWFGDLEGKTVLCLASGGGQQAPILAAAGADVVSFDLSDEQLERDYEVSQRDELSIVPVRGDMADLSILHDEKFDLIFHPVSNVFAPDLAPVWRECYRVLRPGGRLLAGFMNPDFFLFDHDDLDAGGPLELRYPLPFSDVEGLPTDKLAARVEAGEALEHSHSLDAQIGGQLEAGFLIAGFYEDRWDAESTRLDAYMPTFMATMAFKAGF
jgi:SAM-dependent methyltransferase